MQNLILLLVLILFLISCGEDNSVLQVDKTVFVGLLVDENNNPIADAEICLIPNSALENILT